MISRDQMPENNEDLAGLAVEFPRLSPDSTVSCPAPPEEILEYLQMESADGEGVDIRRLRFLRTATVEDHEYWIWSFQEADGTACYVTVSRSAGGQVTIGFDENFYSLTPEQYMLGDYHGVF